MANIKNPIFVMAVGRSGTLFLSKLLALSEEHVVFHEPKEWAKQDLKAYEIKAITGKSSHHYVTKRMKWVLKQMRENKDRQYIEVNGILRSHVSMIMQHFPAAKIFHLVRNGKDVVRSIASKDKSIARKIAKKFGDNLLEYAMEMWANDNGHLSTWIEKRNRIHFEDLIDPPKGLRILADKFEVYISAAAFRSISEERPNKTNHFHVLKWQYWPADQKRIFKTHCGDMMKEFGYV